MPTFKSKETREKLTVPLLIGILIAITALTIAQPLDTPSTSAEAIEAPISQYISESQEVEAHGADHWHSNWPTPARSRRR